MRDDGKKLVDPEYLTQPEAASFLRISLRHFQAMRAGGAELPFIQLGGRVVFARDELIKFMEARTMVGRPQCSAAGPKPR